MFNSFEKMSIGVGRLLIVFWFMDGLPGKIFSCPRGQMFFRNKVYQILPISRSLIDGIKVLVLLTGARISGAQRCYA